MADVTGLTVVKKFPYRGNPLEEFSNTYHFTGDIPADATEWRALFDAVANLEKAVYPSDVTIIRGYGYATDDPHDSAVFVLHLDGSTGHTPVTGTLTSTGGQWCPGDCAVWARWKTSRVTDPGGKPIYLRKYYHGAVGTTADLDVILPAQKTAIETLATTMWDGSFIDGRIIRSVGHEETIILSSASSYVAYRQLKRRGKRPGS